MRIGTQVELWRTPFDATQHQMLDGIEASCASGQAVVDAGRYSLGLEHIPSDAVPARTQERTLARLTHAGCE